jgi:hypothetical protein
MSATTEVQRARHPELVAIQRNLDSVGESDKISSLEIEALRIAQFIASGVISNTDVVAALRNAADRIGLFARHRRDEIDHVIEMGLKGIPSVRYKRDGAPEITPEPPRPLMREVPSADPFPVDALGDVLAPAARGIHDRVQAPIAICGQSVLAAAALAVQGHADVLLPIGGGHAKPVSSYFVTVAATGERKTECDKLAGWAMRKREKAIRDKFDLNLPAYINDKAAWDKAREAAQKHAKGDRVRTKAALDALGPAPVAPLHPLLTCPDPTYEGMCKYLAIGQPSIGIFASEGGQFIGGHGMRDEAKLLTAAGLSAAWDGEPIKRLRGVDGTMILPGRRVAMHLMAQPNVADILFRDGLLADQGLLSRMLVTAPQSVAGTRLWHEERPETDRDLKRYGARLLDIFESPLPLSPGKSNELELRALVLSPDSRRLWVAFADHVEKAIALGGPLEAVKGIANKLPEHAARLAALLTLVSDICAAMIGVDEMRAGIALAEHYASEALRLFGTSRINAEVRLAQRLLDWLLHQWKEPAVSLPDIYQRGLNAIGDQATARRLAAILEDHGWIVKLPEGALVDGKRRREAWRILREAA